MTASTIGRSLALGSLGVLALALAAAAQVPRREPPPLALQSLTGKDSFDRYCATCHGVTGRGDGSLAPSLRSVPADLTTLAQRNGGTFPRARVAASVEGTGRELPAHGPTQMPLWGGIFRWLDSGARARVRIENLVAYVESLQAAPPATAAAAPATGRELFETFCAPCHGGSANGDGPMAAQLKRQPPDLRKLQLRNRGQFPRSQVERIIDGRQIDAHGTRSMPVWGDVFFREPGVSHADADARIEAIIEYIRSFQERPA
jgi:mono/diheme cytochrome c family protein